MLDVPSMEGLELTVDKHEGNPSRRSCGTSDAGDGDATGATALELAIQPQRGTATLDCRHSLACKTSNPPKACTGGGLLVIAAAALKALAGP